MKLVLMRGLPASGKSTKAKKMVNQGSFVRVNRDLIREMLHFGKWSGKNEGLTVDTEKALVMGFLGGGYSVVVDDCNLNPKNKEMWSSVAKEQGAKFEVKSVDTIWQRCVKRDFFRTKTIGEHVIKNMALQFGLFKPKKGIVLCDIDGTIADLTHRLKYARGEEKNWDTFFSLMHKDTPRNEVIDKVLKYENDGYDIVFVTARPEDYRKETETWLEKVLKGYRLHFTMVMRRASDKRDDTVVKQQIYDTYFKHYNVVKVFDDRPSVIRMWRSNGLEVEDVGKGVEF